MKNPSAGVGGDGVALAPSSMEGKMERRGFLMGGARGKACDAIDGAEVILEARLETPEDMEERDTCDVCREVCAALLTMDSSSSAIWLVDNADDGRETGSRAEGGRDKFDLLGDPSDHLAITLASLFPGPGRSRGGAQV